MIKKLKCLFGIFVLFGLAFANPAYSMGKGKGKALFRKSKSSIKISNESETSEQPDLTPPVWDLSRLADLKRSFPEAIAFRVLAMGLKPTAAQCDFLVPYLNSTGTFEGSNEHVNKIMSDPILGEVIRAQCKCPEGYIRVPGNVFYGTGFCVMKYEASSDLAGDLNRAVSRPGVLPWVEIDREAAKRACEANGEGYHLITNSEWMTIARNIEANPVNWSEGRVGRGYLSRGNSCSNNSDLAAPSSDDNDFHAGIFSSHDWSNKRTHSLSNGEIIWDLAGNLAEWVADDLEIEREYSWHEYNSRIITAGDRLQFAPVGKYDAFTNVGEIAMLGNGPVLRGGSRHADFFAGVFAAKLALLNFEPEGSIGFRCAAPLP